MSMFVKKGYFCIIPHEVSESHERYMTRGYAVISQYPKTFANFQKAIKLSRFVDNIKYLGCIYDKNIHEDCMEMEKKIYTNIGSAKP